MEHEEKQVQYNLQNIGDSREIMVRMNNLVEVSCLIYEIVQRNKEIRIFNEAPDNPLVDKKAICGIIKEEINKMHAEILTLTEASKVI